MADVYTWSSNSLWIDRKEYIIHTARWLGFPYSDFKKILFKLHAFDSLQDRTKPVELVIIVIKTVINNEWV